MVYCLADIIIVIVNSLANNDVIRVDIIDGDAGIMQGIEQTRFGLYMP